MRATLGRTVGVLLPLQLVAKAVEAAFPLLLAVWFGRSERTDVYFFGSAVFALAGSLVFSAFQDSAVIPVLTEVRLSSPALAPIVRGSLLVHTAVFGSALAALFGAVAAAWFGARYAGEARVIALASVVPFAVYLVCLSIKTCLGSMLNAEHRYRAGPLASATGALLTLAVVAAGRRSLSVVVIPIGSAAGELAAVAVLTAWLRAARILITPTLARPEPVRRIVRLVASEVGGGAVTRANPVVDQLMAALTGVAGGGTLLKLSGDIAAVPTSILQAVLLPVLLTHLSEHAARGDMPQFRATLRRTLGIVLGAMVAGAAALWLLRAPLLFLALAHGAMDRAGVERIVHLLPYHLVGLGAFAALLVLARAHVAIQNSQIMLSMGVLNAVSNLTFNALLVSRMSLEGLALATSITYGVVAAVFAIRLRTRLQAAPGIALLAASSPP